MTSNTLVAFWVGRSNLSATALIKFLNFDLIDFVLCEEDKTTEVSLGKIYIFVIFKSKKYILY